jgi:hypothetical protein
VRTAPKVGPADLKSTAELMNNMNRAQLEAISRTLSTTIAAISTISATRAFSDTSPQTTMTGTFGSDMILPVSPARIKLAAGAAVYLVSFSANACTGYGFISARRMR